MALRAVKHLDPVVGIDVHSVLVTPGTPPVLLPHPHVGFMLDLREYVEAAKGVIGSIALTIVEKKVDEFIQDHPDETAKLEDQADAVMRHVMQDARDVAGAGRLAKKGKKLEDRISNDLGSNVGAGGSSGRPIFVNGLLRATAGTHAFHVPGLHFPLGEAFVSPPAENPEPSNDGESFMGSKTVLANNDPMSYMALQAMSCWSIGMEPPPHNGAHTERDYPSMPSAVMLPIPAGRPVLVGGPPIMNMAAAAKGLFKAFQGSEWAKTLADKLHLKSGFLRCNVLKAEPVDVTTGEVVVQQNDFTVAGRLPLVWDRYYASHDRYAGAVGVGWQTPADIRLELVRNEGRIGAVARFPDHETAFDALPADDGWPSRTYDWQHGHALHSGDGQLVLRTRDGIEYAFVLPSRWREAALALDADAGLIALPIERIADLNGNAWVFERDLYGRVTRLVEWQRDGQTGRLVECGTGQAPRAGLLTSMTLIDSGGHAHPLVSYEHDHERNLAAAVDAMAHPHHFDYAPGHRMVSHTSARGVSFHYSYQQSDDGVWRVVHAWGENGLFDYRFVYDLARMETRVTDSLGHTSITQMNERGLPVAEIDPLGGVTGYRYDAQGRTSVRTDPDGRAFAWEYDAYGNLLTQTLPDMSDVRVNYNADHKPVSVITPGNRRWRYEWSESGNLLAKTAPTQASTRYEYDRHGQLVAHIGPRGAVTRFAYDRDGNLEAVTDALGNCTRYAHDARANVVQSVNAVGQVSRYEYDRKGNLTRSIEPGGREIHCSYDANGNLTRYRDAIGQLTQLEYSALGNVSKRMAPDATAVEYCYDTEERLIGVVNERGERYRFKRDALGRIIEEVDYWGQTRRYEYSAAGALLKSTDPLGQTIDYETDPLGRILQKRVPDPRRPGGVRLESFSYDRSGNLIVAENPYCRVELSHDAAGRVIEERQGDDFVIVNAYDAAGNRIERVTRLRTNGGILAHTVRYDYDELDAIRLIAIDDAAPITFERDALGQIRVEHLGAEVRRELSYTPDGLLAKQALLAGTGALFASEYAYDANGEMLEKRDSRLGTERYQYDPVGKLTGHLDPTGKLDRFLTDPAGDLLKARIHQGNQAVGSGRDGSSDTWVREGEYDGCYYAFDRAGNLLHKQNSLQDLTLRWDGDGLLIETLAVRHVPETAGGAGGAQGIRTRYEYDVFHRRVKKVTQIQRDTGIWTESALDGASPCCTSCFFWDGEALVAEITQGDQEVSRLLLSVGTAQSSPTPTKRATAAATDAPPIRADGYAEVREWIYYPGTLRPLAGMRRAYSTDLSVWPTTGAQIEAPGIENAPVARYFFHNDPNGAPVRVTDAHGRISWDAQYSGPGKVSNLNARESSEQPIRLQGQYHDIETGLHYNRYRYYDPSIGCFLSQDPIGLAGGVNVYGYGPNTLVWIDAYGLTRKKGRNFDSEFYENQYRRVARGELDNADDFVRGDGVILTAHPNKHGMAKSDQLDVLNNWEKSFTGINSNGRPVDIYWKDGSAVVTQGGHKHKVITAYDNVEHQRWSDPARWKKQSDGEYHDDAWCAFRRNRQR